MQSVLVELTKSTPVVKSTSVVKGLLNTIMFVPVPKQVGLSKVAILHATPNYKNRLNPVDGVIPRPADSDTDSDSDAPAEKFN